MKYEVVTKYDLHGRPMDFDIIYDDGKNIVVRRCENDRYSYGFRECLYSEPMSFAAGFPVNQCELTLDEAIKSLTDRVDAWKETKARWIGQRLFDLVDYALRSETEHKNMLEALKKEDEAV